MLLPTDSKSCCRRPNSDDDRGELPLVCAEPRERGSVNMPRTPTLPALDMLERARRLGGDVSHMFRGAERAEVLRNPTWPTFSPSSTSPAFALPTTSLPQDDPGCAGSAGGGEIRLREKPDECVGGGEVWLRDLGTALGSCVLVSLLGSLGPWSRTSRQIRNGTRAAVEKATLSAACTPRISSNRLLGTGMNS